MKLTRTIWILGFAGMTLVAADAEAKSLNTCTSRAYRYANAKGVSLPSLEVPSPDDLTDAAASAQAERSGAGGQGLAAVPQNRRSPPVATPPHRGSMLLPPPARAFRSC